MQRYFAKEKIENQMILDASDQYHITVVMRMKDNEQIEVVYNQTVYLCCIENVKENLSVRILETREKVEDMIPNVILCVPLLKEQKMDYILQKGTELGASKIVPTLLKRSIIKLDGSKFEKKKERWQKICKEASEQSMRNQIPLVTDLMSICDLSKLEGTKIVCSTKEKEKTLKNVLQTVGICDTLVIVMGPEGGLDELEEEKLVELGFVPVTLGSRILRVETVPLYVLSAVNYNYME